MRDPAPDVDPPALKRLNDRAKLRPGCIPARNHAQLAAMEIGSAKCDFSRHVAHQDQPAARRHVAEGSPYGSRTASGIKHGCRQISQKSLSDLAQKISRGVETASGGRVLLTEFQPILIDLSHDHNITA